MMYPATDFPYVLSEREEINSILYKPINSTQRIKYTCFNVSSNYIILGSTSGSLYLFSRQPCSFLQIIPQSEGVVSHVAISPDEKTIALATTRGIVCLVSLKPTTRLITVSTDHISEQITCLCWNNNSTEIYIGDAVGRVSVVLLSIFAVNGIFQAPACTLMNLDSSIVQINFSSPLLLVSTLARCYICDTIREQYKQIGNKARNGEFGACFYRTHMHQSTGLSVQTEDNNINTRNAFNLISDNDSNILGEDYPRIFCARPGSRLWEVSADGVVIKTHQFKEALAIAPIAIFRSTTLTFSQEEETKGEWPPQSVNFSHLFIIAQKYLFCYTINGLYIIDPMSETVVLWSNEFTNISKIQILDNRMYVMTCDSEFHCLTLSSVDVLITQLYCCKQYYECLNACIIYKSQLSKTLNTKEVLEALELENLPQLSQDEKALTLLQPLISLLHCNNITRSIQSDTGIVTVNSEDNESMTNRRVYTYESIARSSDTSSEDLFEARILEFTEDLDENVLGNTSEIVLKKTIDNNVETTNDKDNQKAAENVTHKVQSDLEPIYSLVNSIKPTISEEETEEIMLDMDKKMKTIKESYKDSPGLQNFIYEITRVAELHYYSTILENASIQLLCCTKNDYIVRQFTKAFIDINACSYARCSCSYPYPTDEIVKPKFLAVGEALIRRYAVGEPEECSNICNKIPYMWREYLPICIERQTLDNLLRQCLQIRDNVVLSFLLPALNESQWNSIETCLNEVENGTCLFCAVPLIRNSNYNMAIDWCGIAKEVMKRDGPDKAAEFLIKLESKVTDVSFDKSIFQSIVFTKILHHNGLKKFVDFDKANEFSAEFGTMCSAQIADQLAITLEKDLKRPIDKSMFGDGAHHWGMRYQVKSPSCPCCTLPLQTPILLGDDGIAIFRCGHAYHVNCMVEKKLTRCNLHRQTVTTSQ